MTQQRERKFSKLAIASLVCGGFGLTNLLLHLMALKGMAIYHHREIGFLDRVYIFIAWGISIFPPTLCLKERVEPGNAGKTEKALPMLGKSAENGMDNSLSFW